jgi:hypothetical protein
VLVFVLLLLLVLDWLSPENGCGMQPEGLLQS